MKSNDHRKATEKLPPILGETPEYDAETLHRINFEIIHRLLEIWRSYKDRKENRPKIFNLGVKLHGLIVESIKIDRDVQDLAELHKVSAQLEEELAVLRRNRGVLAYPERWVSKMTADEQLTVARAIKRVEQETPGPLPDEEFITKLTPDERAIIIRAMKKARNALLPIDEQVDLKVKELEATPGAFDTGPVLDGNLTPSKSTSKERDRKE